MKLGWRMAQIDSLTFVADLTKGTGPGLFLTSFKTQSFQHIC